MRSILNHALACASTKPRHLGLMAGTALLLLSGMMGAFGTSQDTVTFTGKLNDVIEHVEIPSLSEGSFMPKDADIQTREARIKRGDTVFGLLAELNIQDAAAEEFLRTNPTSEPIFRQLVPGKTITAKLTTEGELRSLVFPLNSGKDAALFIQRNSGRFDASVQELPVETQVVRQAAVIRHSLFAATDEAGIPDSVATQLADIFAGDIDFHRDLRKGDRFAVVYETATNLGKPIRTQHILAAEFVNDGKIYRAFWHPLGNGSGAYYTAEGTSLKKAFLRSPLEFSRITSGFSNARFHPVLKEVRAHRGIDYGAPIGTRVRATGDGIVDFVGNQGGYGKVIIVRHPGNRQTVYGHLSGFATGLTKGKRVSQGETIGFVGATGLATGPHLHYEFRIAGIHRNPLAIALPPAPPLPQTQLATFRAEAAKWISQISTIRDVQFVLLD